MNQLKIIGKYLDQPIITAKFSKAVPPILVGGALATTGIEALKEDRVDKRNKRVIQNACVLSGTVASALIATRGLKIKGKQVIKGLSEIVKPEDVLKTNKKHVENFKKLLQSNTDIDEKTKNLFKNKDLMGLLEKTTKKALNKKEIEKLYTSTEKNEWGKRLVKKLIPEPKAVDSKDIWKELGRLSLLGAVPVAGGITGGAIGDRLTCDRWKDKMPNKIKEGAYQYLANIVLCNVGAGAALASLEGLKKAKVVKKVTPLARGLSMFGGILTTGVIGGSAIANYLSKKYIDPVVDKNTPKNVNVKNLYDERHPEPIDIGLHVDDIATVGVMSGFNWIEPALPLLYSISGYRAGIGYRNGNNKHCGDYQNQKNKQPNKTFKGRKVQRARRRNNTFKDFAS